MIQKVCYFRFLLVVTTTFAIAPSAGATFVQIDFNELDYGQLRDQPAGGTGLTGFWAGNSANAQVGDGNLTAPAGTNFNLTQSPGNKRAQFSLTGNDRQQWGNFATPLYGTIWGTFLVNNNNGGRAGIGINTLNTSDFGTAPRLLVDGTDFMFITNSNTRTVATGVVPTDGDSLILFKTVFVPEERTQITIDAWINPNLLQPLPAPHVSAISTHPGILPWLDGTDDGFYRVAPGGWRPTGSPLNALVDFITLSDGPNAFTDVTGRPFLEPSAVPGDFDGNGTVGPEDYDLWHSTFGSTSVLDADGNGNNVIDAADYVVWRKHFVSPGMAAAIPEPGAIILMMMALAAVVSARPHRRLNP